MRVLTILAPLLPASPQAEPPPPIEIAPVQLPYEIWGEPPIIYAPPPEPLPVVIPADRVPRAPTYVSPDLKAMLEAAIATGNDGEVNTIVKYARTADPASGDPIAQIAANWRAARARAQEAHVREAAWFDLWTGRAELGGSITTGNSDILGVNAVLDLTREGLQWRHQVLVQADYQRSLGITTREHLLVGYQANYKINARTYIYGNASFETDPFLGFDERYAASVGAGYSVIQNRGMTLDLELGPAYRFTRFADDERENSLGGRGNLAFGWNLASGLRFTQNAQAVVQRFNSTVRGTSAVAARLFGPLSAQVSYNVQFESDPPGGRRTTDTTGRASLVYTF